VTQSEALQEARRRWGDFGFARIAPYVYRPRKALPPYSVGRADKAVYGAGDSWEAAFADADRREKGGAA
jgi:hypothetical protein